MRRWYQTAVLLLAAAGVAALLPALNSFHSTRQLEARTQAANARLETLGSGTGKAVILLVDVSGSMEPEEIAQARSLLLKLAGDMNTEDRVGLVTFDDSAHLLVPPTAGRAGLARVREALGSLKAGGGSNLHAGLQMAYDSFPSLASERYLLVVSDGEPNVGVLEGTGYQHFANNGAVTSVVLTGEDSVGVLRWLGARGGGWLVTDLAEAPLMLLHRAQE